MRPRPLGHTGLHVSPVGFGAWQLGNSTDWKAMPDDVALELVATALDLGVTLFDTAPHYANTNSERLLGEGLAGRRADVVLVSKFGHTLDGGKDFSVAAFERELEGSLRRLRTDFLDVLLLHNPGFDLLAGDDPIWSALDAAKRDGRLRHYGVSLDTAAEVEACVGQTGSTVLEVLFNVFHQDVRRAFSRVRAAGTGLIAKVPLDSGWLTGRFDGRSSFTGVRARWTPEQIAQRAALLERIAWLTDTGDPLAHRALGYLLSYEEVGCVIPGTRTLEQLRDNVAAANCEVMGAERQRLEALWDEVTHEGRQPLPW